MIRLDIASLVGAAAISTAFLFGGMAGHIATAAAEPNNSGGEWDLGAYDACMAGAPNDATLKQLRSYVLACCVKSGGVWDETNWRCSAPPARGDNSSQKPRRAVIPPGSLEPLGAGANPSRQPARQVDTGRR